MNKDSPHPEDNTLQILANALEGMTHNLRCGVNLIELICRSVDGLNRDESDALNFLTRGMKGEIKKAEIIYEGLQEWPGEEKGQNEEIELANDQAQFAKELIENLAKMRQTPKPTRAASLSVLALRNPSALRARQPHHGSRIFDQAERSIGHGVMVAEGTGGVI